MEQLELREMLNKTTENIISNFRQEKMIFEYLVREINHLTFEGNTDKTYEIYKKTEELTNEAFKAVLKMRKFVKYLEEEIKNNNK